MAYDFFKYNADYSNSQLYAEPFRNAGIAVIWNSVRSSERPVYVYIIDIA